MIGTRFKEESGWLSQPIKNPKKHITAKGVEYFDKDGFELTPAEVVILKANGINVPKYKDCVMFQKTVHADMKDHLQKFLPPGIVVDHACSFVRYGFAGDLRQQIIEHVDNTNQTEVVKLLTIVPKWGIDISLDFVDIDVENNSYEVFEVLHIEHDFESFNELDAMDEEVADKIVSISHSKWFEIIKNARMLNSLELDVGTLRDAKAKLFGFEYGERPRKIY